MQRVGFLAIVPRLLRGFAVDPSDVLTIAGLPATALDDPEAMIPFAAMGVLVEAAVRATNCEHFGLLIGQATGLASLGPIGELMRHAPTLRVALLDLATHQHRHARGAVSYLLERDDHALFGYAIYSPGTRAPFQIYDGAGAAAFNLVRALIPVNGLRDIEVLLSRATPADPGPYRRFFNTKLHFEQDQTGVLIPRSWLDRPTAGADVARRKHLETRIADYAPAGEHGIVAQVRGAIRVGLVTGEFSGEHIATRVRVPRRTLQRRLVSHGTGFQEVLDESRFEFASHLLTNTSLPVGDIGQIVRYADPSVFTRAFTRWAGMPPNEWRLSRRATAG